MQNKNLEKAVEKALELSEKTGDFIIQQAPDVIREFYTWQITISIFAVVMSVLLFLLGRYIPYMYLSRDKKTFNTRFFKRYGDLKGEMSWFLFGFCTFFSLAIFLRNLLKLLYILIAPKMYIIEYFLVK